jgi:hypothetical protein
VPTTHERPLGITPVFTVTRHLCSPFRELTIYPLQVLRRQYEKELESPHVSVQTKFNLAWGLVKSPRHEDQLEGVKLLQGVSRPSLLSLFSGLY